MKIKIKQPTETKPEPEPKPKTFGRLCICGRVTMFSTSGKCWLCDAERELRRVLCTDE